ncbi:MAG: hypothetical protein ACP5D7_05805 [Limnospira sp.]
MNAYQLSLFPDEPPIPIAPHIEKRQKQPPAPKPIAIAETYSTAKLADFLGVSPSTLTRHRRAGNAYTKGSWTAKPLGKNTWTLIYTPPTT